jgi:hypothetical protein
VGDGKRGALSRKRLQKRAYLVVAQRFGILPQKIGRFGRILSVELILDLAWGS